VKEDIMQGQILSVRYDDGQDIDLGYRVKIRFHAPFGSHEFKVGSCTAKLLGKCVGEYGTLRIHNGQFLRWDANDEKGATS
jgi:hypothetical protein